MSILGSMGIGDDVVFRMKEKDLYSHNFPVKRGAAGTNFFYKIVCDFRYERINKFVRTNYPIRITSFNDVFVEFCGDRIHQTKTNDLLEDFLQKWFGDKVKVSVTYFTYEYF